MLNDATRQKLTQLVDVQERAPKDDSGLWNAISREAYVIGGGLKDGISGNLNQKALFERSPEFLIAYGIGATLAAARGKTGIIRLGAEIGAGAMTVAFAKDMLDPGRLSGLGTAVSDTWNSSQNLDRNRAMVKHNAGDFVFDSMLMAGGGIAGASSVRIGNSQTLRNMRSLFGKPAQETVGNSGLLVRNAETNGTGLLGRNVETTGNSGLLSRGVETRGYALGSTDAVVRGAAAGHLPPWEVLPQGPIKSSSRATRLVENADQMPLAEVRKAETITLTVEGGKTIDWVPSQESIAIRMDAQRFTDFFMKGQYVEALQVAIEGKVNNFVDLNPKSRAHEVLITSQDLKSPDILRYHMSRLSSQAEFKWGQTIRDGVIGEQKLEVVVPKPVIQLSDNVTRVSLVDFVPNEAGNGYSVGYRVVLPETTTTGAKLTPAQVAEIKAIRQSPEGQRLLAETALFGFEESIVHANQHIMQGGRITSPSYAEWTRGFAESNLELRAPRLSFMGMIDSQHKLRPTYFEQEVPALLYDAGMPLSVVRHHFFFGPRHVPERTPIMKYLENRELNATSNATANGS